MPNVKKSTSTVVQGEFGQQKSIEDKNVAVGGYKVSWAGGMRTIHSRDVLLNKVLVKLSQRVLIEYADYYGFRQTLILRMKSGERTVTDKATGEEAVFTPLSIPPVISYEKYCDVINQDIEKTSLTQISNVRKLLLALRIKRSG